MTAFVIIYAALGGMVTTLNLREMGMPVCDIAKAVNMPEKQVEEWLGLIVS